MIREFIEAQEDGKAFPYVPWLTDAGGPLIGSGSGYYGAYNPYVSNAGAISYGRTQTPLMQREAAIHLQTYGGMEPVDWLYDAVNFTTACCVSADYHFIDSNATQFVTRRKPTDPKNIKEAPYVLAKLFEKPNPYQLWDEFLEITLIDFLLVGNSYWVKWKETGKNQPSALYRMHPGSVRIIPDQFGPAKYLYRLPGTAADTTFTPDQVIHFKRPNPHDPIYGLGIVKGGATALDMELALTKTMASYYEKRALPSGVVQTERRVPRDVFNKLKHQLRAFYGNSTNAGQLMVLEAGLKYQTVSPSAQDAQFANMAGWSRDRVLSLFHLNKTLLGQSEQRQLTDGELDAWQRLFDNKTVIPLLNRLQKLISNALTQPGWGLDFEFDYLESQAPDDIVKRATVLAALPGVKVHELRSAAGLPPSTGDKSIDDMVLNLPSPNMDENGQGGAADRNLPGEPGRPPKPENTQAISGSVRKKKGSPAAVAGGTSGKALIDEILSNMETQQAILGVKALAPARTHVGAISQAHPPEDKLVSTRLTSLDNLTAQVEGDILAAVHTLERGLLDSSEGKAEGTMYQRIKNSKAWAIFRAKLDTILQAAAEQALSLANIHHASQGLKPNLGTDYSAVAKSLIHRPEGGVMSIVANTKKEVLADILSLQRHGSTPGEFTKQINEAVQKWVDGHAKTIALTEATIAYNEGTLQVAEANDKSNVIVSDGNDFDEPCAAANGATWTVEQARENMIQHPNCRRAFVPA
jgi:HK97 family phage portal protein